MRKNKVITSSPDSADYHQDTGTFDSKYDSRDQNARSRQWGRQSGSKLLYALLLLLLLGFIWGSGYSLAKYAMTHGVPALGYSFWQSAGPAFLLGLFTLSQRGQLMWHVRYWRYYLICGLLGIAIPNTNMYLVAAEIPAGLLAVLVNTVPLMVYPLALMLRLEKPDIWRFFAILVGIAGILVIINPALHSLWNSWALMALISPLSFALCALYIAARQPDEMHPLPAAAGMLMTATLLLTPLVWQQNAFYSLQWPLDRPQQVVLLEIILSSLGYLIFFRLIRLAGPVFYSLTGTVVALTGLFWGFLIFGEAVEWLEWAGIVLIVNAILVLTWRQSLQSTPEEPSHAK